LTASTSGDRFGRLAAALDRQFVTGRSAMDEFDDSPLVRAARAGDRLAFGQLYDRYARMVHGILLTRVPLCEVDDLVHDVFLRALPRLHTLRELNRFGAWLAAIARNCANDYHRRGVAEVELDDEVAENVQPGQAAPRAHSTEAESILRVIRSLPEAYRETLLLRLVEGMTGPEIAARTGLTAGSVRVNLHRGMQQLREKLGPTKRNSSQAMVELDRGSPHPDRARET
jgi:RNA polymerase sigma-70 factor (ECF subfamily)